MSEENVRADYIELMVQALQFLQYGLPVRQSPLRTGDLFKALSFSIR
jgi:hypothetical protein